MTLGWVLFIMKNFPPQALRVKRVATDYDTRGLEVLNGLTRPGGKGLNSKNTL